MRKIFTKHAIENVNMFKIKLQILVLILLLIMRKTLYSIFKHEY